VTVEHGPGLHDAGDGIAAGDFDADGVPDLAVGAPSMVFLDPDEIGEVGIFHGPLSGRYTFDDADVVLRTGCGGDMFGFSLAAGDISGDAIDDLVIGVPFSDPGARDAGSVVLVLGGSGL
jgi:hypothetical protein